MQSKGWIWQACLLLAVSFIFSTSMPLPQAFSQTETTPQEKTEPQADESEDAPEESAEDEDQESSDKDQQKEDGKEKSDDKQDDDDDDENKEDKDGESGDDEESDENGSEDLSEAFLLKFEARTTLDLDKIVALCESALRKGLDENESEQAKYLASDSLLRFAEGMAQRTFTPQRDRRWQAYRAQALPRLRKAVEFNESNVAAFILLAKFEAMDPQSKAQALKNIEKAIELSVDDREQLSDALVIRARLKEDKDAALADLNQAIKHNPANTQAHQLRAWALLGDNKATEAIEDFEYWFKAEPKNFDARVIVAGRLSASESFDADMQEKVLEILNEAEEIDPESAIPGTIKAQIFLNQKEFEKAIEAASQSIELDKRAPVAYKIRAAALAEQGDLDGAIKDASKLMKLDLMEGYQLRSQLLIQKGEYAKAIEDISAMSAANPKDEGMKQRLAILYNADLRPEESIKIYSKLLRDNLLPDEDDQPASIRRIIMAKRADLLSNRANARLSTGEHAKAIADYEESLELIDKFIASIPEGVNPKPTRDSGLLNNFAWLLSTTPEDDLRDGERAIKLATESAELTDFEQPHILSTVAAAYAETGDFKTAIEWINKGLEANKVVGAKEGANEEAIKKQEKNLLDELKAYKEEKPWREKMDPEEEREKAKAEKEAKEKESSKNKKSADDSDDEEEPENDDKEDDSSDKEVSEAE